MNDTCAESLHCLTDQIALGISYNGCNSNELNWLFNMSSAPTLKDYLMLMLLASIWGASFLFIKIAVETIPPLTITAGRITLAAFILFTAAKMAGQTRPQGMRNWMIICGAAFFGNVLPFTLISWGEIKVDSGLAAVLMSLMPLATIILAHFFTTDEPLTKRKVIGLIVGFTGVIILIGPTALNSLGAEMIAQIAIAFGAVSYSIASIMAKRLHNIPGRALAAWVMIISTIMILPASLIVDQPWTLSPAPMALAAVVMLGLFPTALAMLLLLQILRKHGASFLSMNNYMVPVFGVMWGVIFLAEKPSPESAIALIFILSGIAITRVRITRKK